jgi:hypothetical protein
MGANAQTKVPTFAPAEVLTAANTNLLSNGIGVFSGTATRDAAFGGSGEKVLAEGQFAFLEDSNSTQFYDGAAWQSVAGGGMTLLSTTTLSGATTAITGISQDYNDLYIYLTDWYASSAANLNMFVNGNSTAANYVGSYIRNRIGTSTGFDSTTAVTAWSEGPGQHNNFQIITLPNYTNASVKFWNSSGYMDTDNGQKGIYIGAGAYFNGTSAITSLTFAPTAGTFSAGTVKIYGVK